MRSKTAQTPQWILAHAQTAAHGRRGRAWGMPKGNFAASLLCFPSDPPERVALRSFICSLALYEALIALTGRAESFALKWPNDVLCNGGKLAGILLEGGPGFLIVGIGVNLVETPASDFLEEGALAPVDLLSATGVLIKPEELLDTMAPIYAHYEQQFITDGFEPIREAWLRRAAKVGENIRAKTMREEHYGVFETVDTQGNLVLRTAKGKLAIPAAEVYF